MLRAPRMWACLLLASAALAAALPAEPAAQPAPTTLTTLTDLSDDQLDERSWFTFPLFGNLFAPLWRLFPFADIGPKIVADENNFRIIVNVKDYNKDELKVKVKGYYISVQGSHEAKQDNKDVFASQFYHTYTLPVNASGADVVAELTSDGYLVVSAPLNGEPATKIAEERVVPIVETGKPYLAEDARTEQPTAGTATADSGPGDEDRKEPTTPASERDLVTDRDNTIPHGNEPLAL